MRRFRPSHSHCRTTSQGRHVLDVGGPPARNREALQATADADPMATHRTLVRALARQAAREAWKMQIDSNTPLADCHENGDDLAMTKGIGGKHRHPSSAGSGNT